MIWQIILFITTSLGSKIGDQPTSVDTVQAIADIRAGAVKTTLAGIHICDLERIEFDTHVHMTKDGEEYGWFDDQEDILVEGMVCGTKNDVVLAVDDSELHGTLTSKRRLMGTFSQFFFL